jgi:MYXO-CTERM domain-containing protein
VVVADPDNLSTGLTATISTVSATPSVAEPASAALLVSAILALAALTRKRRRDV